ncbi:hypothetical protein Tco_1301190 [Tanacetum coccineum]
MNPSSTSDSDTNRKWLLLLGETEPLLLKVSMIKQEMSEVKKTDHSADVLASIRSQVHTALIIFTEKNFDDASLSHMYKKKVANKKSPPTYRLYHASWELDCGGDAWIRKVADKCKRPQEESMIVMMMKTMMMMKALQLINRVESQRKEDLIHAASGITDTREAGADSSMHRSNPESEHSEQSSDDISKQDEGMDQLWRTLTTLTFPRCRPLRGLSPIPKSERPATPDQNWFHRLWVKNVNGDYEISASPMASLTGGLGGRIIININTDVKNLVDLQNDFEDCSFSYIQENLNPSARQTRTSLHTAVNMWIRNLIRDLKVIQQRINLERPNWDAADYYFKEDYTIVPKPRAVVYRDRNDQRKLMRLNELHKFSDGTLTRVMEKLDQMVKDFHLYEYNKGMETRKWSEDDKRRSKDFITAIEKRLQIRRIYRSLESFVGGRIRDIDYRLINRTT